MKAESFRGNTIGMVIYGCFLSLILIVFSTWSHYIFLVEPTPTGVRVFISILDCCLFFFGVLCLVENLCSYFTQVQVVDNQLFFIYPFKKRMVISTEKLSCWGCVAYAPRSTKLFFCMADRDVLLNYYDTHRALCERIFRTHRVHRLEQSDDGVFRLAVGTYLYKHMFFPRKDTFILSYCTPSQLKILENVLKKDALITGPWLIDTISAWEH